MPLYSAMSVPHLERAEFGPSTSPLVVEIARPRPILVAGIAEEAAVVPPRSVRSQIGLSGADLAVSASR
jgi:hypothetical protein